MKLEERIESFSALGRILRDALEGRGGKYGDKLNILIDNQVSTNAWFTPENVRMAITAIAGELTVEKLKKWTSKYPALGTEKNPSRIGVIMAGNIPLAGFHDFLSILISGNKIIARTSSKDPELIVAIADILISTDNRFRNRIEFQEGIIQGFDAIIATGSNNSSRYFDYYFSKYPQIIRKNRNSVAVISGNESEDDLANLGNDIFSYFGLGCRNVSKLFVPEGYEFTRMINCWGKHSGLTGHTKYANNYDFHMAVYLVNKEPFIDTGFLLMRESLELSSPVAVLHYEYYDTFDRLAGKIDLSADKIQCVIGKGGIPFGTSQSPSLWDYADNVDTLDFLLKKNMSERL